MGSGRGDRNQEWILERHRAKCSYASMGSGRGDRNQVEYRDKAGNAKVTLQWGPVVVTGIRFACPPLGLVLLAGFNGVRSW